jgi:hypothetical protein
MAGESIQEYYIDSAENCYRYCVVSYVFGPEHGKRMAKQRMGNPKKQVIIRRFGLVTHCWVPISRRGTSICLRRIVRHLII